MQTSDSEQPTSIKSRLPLGKGLSIDVKMCTFGEACYRFLKPRELFCVLRDTFPFCFVVCSVVLDGRVRAAKLP